MRILIPGLILGTFTCGTSHGSSALIYQTDTMDGKRMMPLPKKLVTVRREQYIKILQFRFLLLKKRVANVARISVILGSNLGAKKYSLNIRVFQFLRTQIHALEL